MRKPVLIAVLALVVVLALGVALYIATRPDGTSSDDPLVRQSYANGEYSQTLLQNAATTCIYKLPTSTSYRGCSRRMV